MNLLLIILISIIIINILFIVFLCIGGKRNKHYSLTKDEYEEFMDWYKNKMKK